MISSDIQWYPAIRWCFPNWLNFEGNIFAIFVIFAKATAGDQTQWSVSMCCLPDLKLDAFNIAKQQKTSWTRTRESNFLTHIYTFVFIYIYIFIYQTHMYNYVYIYILYIYNTSRYEKYWNILKHLRTMSLNPVIQDDLQAPTRLDFGYSETVNWWRNMEKSTASKLELKRGIDFSWNHWARSRNEQLNINWVNCQ